MLSRRDFGRLLGLGVAFQLGCAASALAQSPYPNRPIKMVVPFGAGGSTDTLARQVSDDLARILGQPVIIENRPGAGGVIGRTYVATAPADGYTLLFAENTLAIGQAIQGNGPDNNLADRFEAIAGVATSPSALVVANKVPAATVKELVDYSKKFPQRLTSATVGIGSVSHLSFEVLKVISGLTAVSVPYKGGGQALADVVAGHVDIAMSSAQTVKSLLETQRLKVLAITGNARLASMPNVPTLQEAGIPTPAVDMSFWFGVFGPKDMPANVRAALEQAVAKALADESVKAKLAKADMHTQFLPAGAMQAKLRSEISNWSLFIQKHNIKVN